MEPVTLILTALAAGASDTASPAVKDAHAGLKAELRTRLEGREGEEAVARYEDAPQTWESRLAAELAAAGADRDEGLVRSAQALLSVADEPGWRAGKYAV
jgi:hypothetical protein